MKQRDIDRYNKGQDKWKASDWQNGVMLYNCNTNKNGTWVVLYDFLFNPKWGWRETFDKDPDWQKEFWEWIEYHYTPKTYSLGLEKGVTKPQMLTGYIQEFMEGQI